MLVMTMLQTLYAWLGASGKGSELALKLNALHETLMCSLTFSSAVAASGAKALSQAASHASSLTAGAPCCMSSSSLSRSIASTAVAAAAAAADAALSSAAA